MLSWLIICASNQKLTMCYCTSRFNSLFLLCFLDVSEPFLVEWLFISNVHGNRVKNQMHYILRPIVNVLVAPLSIDVSQRIRRNIQISEAHMIEVIVIFYLRKSLGS